MVKVWQHLAKDVVTPDYCIGCGSCVATCPVQALERVNEKPTLKGVCINCGICYGTCPEVIDPQSLQIPVFGAPPNDELIGTFRHALSVEANDPSVKIRAQDGGAVTALLSSLLEIGYIDAAIVTGTDAAPWYPVVKVATCPEEVAEGAGTKYSRGPTSLGLREAVNMYYRKKVAIVGTPCQIIASRRMALSTPKNEHLSDAIKLRIGLFCSGVFNYERFFKNIVEKSLQIPLASVSKFDLKNEKLIVYLKHEPSRELPLSEIRKYIDLPCRICSNFSAETADISIGYLGSPAGKSTVLLRTELGEEAFAEAGKLGKFTVTDLTSVQPGLDAIRQEALKKRTLAAQTIEALRKEKKVLPVWLEHPAGETTAEPIESYKGTCTV
ncbi:MAG: Coenzyme F420 hydrogenase/dehydrogenase, beta subunit C-terminal domain [Candidatus Hadarchaeum sp.]|uniref:Coenzyme F420 hydrogenase/dehydrogenase, beta subunit C-terminal domain n=1 Tax=Candidatus Hadarchaeum sp. TaxID=2883567 RepID=UPI003D105877